MAKRKVKRKAPKRKRKVAKRKVVKRKAPKRRRKRKFGSFIADMKKKAAGAAKSIGDAGGKAKTMFIDLGGKQILPLLSGYVDFKETKKELKTAEQQEIADGIEKSMKADLEKGDVDFKSTIAYFKETAKTKSDELKAAFYKILAEKKIYKQAEGKWKEALEQIPGPAKVAVSNLTEYSQFTGLLKNLYKSQKDAGKKLAFNLLGSLLTNTEEDDGKVFKDGEEGTHGLINDIKAAGTAAIDAAKKELETKAETTETKEETKTETETKTEEQKEGGSFGKRKRGPSASLKRMCKKHGVRLTVKRGKKRVYKSSKVLKEQCKNKLKNKIKKNKKKNFTKKKK